MLRILNQGSLWSAVAPAALVRYCTASGPAAAVAAGAGSPVRAAPPSRAVRASAARARRPGNEYASVVLSRWGWRTGCVRAAGVGEPPGAGLAVTDRTGPGN